MRKGNRREQEIPTAAGLMALFYIAPGFTLLQSAFSNVFCSGFNDTYQVMILRSRIVVLVKPNVESRRVPNV